MTFRKVSAFNLLSNFRIDTFGTGTQSDDKIAEVLCDLVDLTPRGIIRTLDLRRPIYKQFASYGHMGRTELDAPWEKIDLAEKLRKYFA